MEDARLHGGYLQAWGEPGHGSSFRLTLPWHVGGPVGDPPLPLEPPADETDPATTPEGVARA
jgi:two-component system sensor histidine kinase MtrB